MLTEIGARLRSWRRRFSRAEWEFRSLRLPRSDAPAHSPGLLLVQIDGLSRTEFERAIESGKLPFIRHLLRREGSRLHTFYSGVPSTTPAVQAELHYGVRAAVPAFSFLDPRAESIGAMMHPECAKRIEADLAERNEGLLKGGSSWSNIYTGGATQADSHFCGASIGLGDMWKTGKIRNIFLFVFLHLPSCLRLLALLPVEFFLSIGSALRGMARGQTAARELVFILARVFICVGLRELVTLGAKIDLARGLPVIHVNFLGYDEQAHRRGPASRLAHWTLLGIDRTIRQLHRAARRSNGRDYEVWIFSDHGQVRVRPFAQVCEGGLEGLLRRHWPGLDAPARAGAGPHRSQDRSAHAPPFHFPGRNRQLERQRDRSKLSAFERAEFAVASMGPVGHVYFKKPLGEEQELALVRALLEGGVPGVLRREADDAVSWHTRERVCPLPGDTSLLRAPEALLSSLAHDLADLARHRFAGDLVCLGWHPELGSFTFADENGSHCGPSPDEVQGLLVLPPASNHLLPQAIVRPVELREAALRHLGRAPRPVHRRRHPPPPAPHLRVVTYNVHYCRGLDGRFAPDRIARVLRDLDPDIVALQELDCGRPRSRGDDQLAHFAAELGLHQLFCPSIVKGEERYGHGLLSTRPIRLVRQARLPTGDVPVIEPRDGLHAVVDFDGREITVITTHLGLAYPERAAQIDRLLESDFLGGVESDRPALFMGDLNLVPGGRLYRRLVARWSGGPNGHACFRDVQAHAPNHVAVKTFPSFLPVRQLDHIFVTRHFGILGVRSPANLLTRRASDHLPLVADLELHA